ncbi:hypothetical protein [Tunicatimonas pelagia]|uniref:hypothetical protein n=1 Tax=Tunicatimonas pelagia TaxID=931531 RepID=UPI002666FD45|nr:hypothetical protein [Tunicatimonas pelagia]WKN45223.1 hypothetical protein P0M28_09655 [Tunicatimonas pelagia]
MNTVRTILTEQSRIVSILTLILLLWVTGGTAVHFPRGESDLANHEQSVPADDADQSTTISNFQEAVIPISKIHILFVYHFLREWVLIEEETSTISANAPLPPSQLFLTLFRQIISPNAP